MGLTQVSTTKRKRHYEGVLSQFETLVLMAGVVHLSCWIQTHPVVLTRLT